jgi:uncharacterized protein
MRGPRPIPAALAAALLLLAAGCGKKGNLRPPLRLVPQAAEGLRATQRGARIVLAWTNPDTYNDGSPLAAIASVEIWEGAEAGDFPDAARLVKSLAAADLEPLRAAPGPDSRAYGISFLPSGAAPAGGRPRLFALRVIDARRQRASEFTAPVAVNFVPVPMPPADVRADVAEDRIVLRWTPPTANADSSTPAALGGYTVYRAEGEAPARRLTERPVAEPLFADADFQFGRAYHYIVRAVAAADAAAESEDSTLFDLTPRDVFAPAPPAGLTATSGGSVITLLWDPGREADLAGYKVWRRDAGRGEWTLLTAAPVAGNAYTDAAAAKGIRYEYAVSSLDASGNESARCAPAAEILKEARI